MSKATTNDLADLHGMFTEALAKKLKNGDFTSADLSVIRQFLRDNGIECDGERNDGIQDLVDSLPSYDSDEDGAGMSCGPDGCHLN
jgi:hypothetical protein